MSQPSPVDKARVELQRQLRRTLSGADTPPVRGATDDEPGLFGPDSAAWIVHTDASMLIGGIRALLYQLLHPRAMAGVAEHSDYEHDPLGRLHRTASFLGATTFGTAEQAHEAIEIVRTIHDRVQGVSADGKPYDANDPHLLAWVHATEVDSFLAAFNHYGSTPLAADEQDQYVAEMAQIAEGLGAVHAPHSTAELAEVLAGFEPEMRASSDARRALRFLLAPPLPNAARLPYAVLSGAAIGLLPRHARRMLRLPAPPLVGELVVRPTATAMVRTIGWALTAPEPDAA